MFTLERDRYWTVQYRFYFYNIRTKKKKKYSSLKNTEIMNFETIRTFFIVITNMHYYITIYIFIH